MDKKYKMKFLHVTSLILGAAIALTSCKKKTGENEKLDPNKHATVAEYMSTKPGSYWIYKSNEGNIHKRTATGLQETVNNKLYDLYITVDTTSAMKEEIKTYFAKNENRYLTLIDIDGKQENYVEAIVYKDDAKVDDEWLNTGKVKISGFNLDVEIYSEVIDINATKEINGVVYDSVFVTKNKLKARQVPLVPSFVNVGTVEMWFKKGVGILGSDFDISVMSFYTRKYNDGIVTYHIEP